MWDIDMAQLLARGRTYLARKSIIYLKILIWCKQISTTIIDWSESQNIGGSI
jgi:hypothetical protein